MYVTYNIQQTTDTNKNAATVGVTNPCGCEWLAYSMSGQVFMNDSQWFMSGIKIPDRNW